MSKHHHSSAAASSEKKESFFTRAKRFFVKNKSALATAGKVTVIAVADIVVYKYVTKATNRKHDSVVFFLPNCFEAAANVIGNKDRKKALGYLGYVGLRAVVYNCAMRGAMSFLNK